MRLLVAIACFPMLTVALATPEAPSSLSITTSFQPLPSASQSSPDNRQETTSPTVGKISYPVPAQQLAPPASVGLPNLLMVSPAQGPAPAAAPTPAPAPAPAPAANGGIFKPTAGQLRTYRKWLSQASLWNLNWGSMYVTGRFTAAYWRQFYEGGGWEGFSDTAYQQVWPTAPVLAQKFLERKSAAQGVDESLRVLETTTELERAHIGARRQRSRPAKVAANTAGDAKPKMAAATPSGSARRLSHTQHHRVSSAAAKSASVQLPHSSSSNSSSSSSSFIEVIWHPTDKSDKDANAAAAKILLLWERWFAMLANGHFYLNTFCSATGASMDIYAAMSTSNRTRSLSSSLDLGRKWQAVHENTVGMWFTAVSNYNLLTQLFPQSKEDDKKKHRNERVQVDGINSLLSVWPNTPQLGLLEKQLLWWWHLAIWQSNTWDLTALMVKKAKSSSDMMLLMTSVDGQRVGLTGMFMAGSLFLSEMKSKAGATAKQTLPVVGMAAGYNLLRFSLDLNVMSWSSAPATPNARVGMDSKLYLPQLTATSAMRMNSKQPTGKKTSQQ